jgi:hypothetical protein
MNNNNNRDNNKDNNKIRKNDFVEYVVKYMKYDELLNKTIIEHKKEIDELKMQKKELEFFLIKYLDENDNDIINYGKNIILKKIERRTKNSTVIELKKREKKVKKQ